MKFFLARGVYTVQCTPSAPVVAVAAASVAAATADVLLMCQPVNCRCLGCLRNGRAFICIAQILAWKGEGGGDLGDMVAII